jgi:hypothetical protein
MKGLSLIFKQETKQEYVIKKKHKNQKQGHKICKTNVKKNIYYVDVCKYEHEKNMTRLWCKIVPKTNAEQIKRNEGSYFYLYLFKDLTQGNF